LDDGSPASGGRAYAVPVFGRSDHHPGYRFPSTSDEDFVRNHHPELVPAVGAEISRGPCGMLAQAGYIAWWTAGTAVLGAACLLALT